MNVTIRSIDNVMFSGSALEITLPGLYGTVGIRPHHSSMSVTLGKGKIMVRLAEKEETFWVESGIAHVSDNTVDVLIMK